MDEINAEGVVRLAWPTNFSAGGWSGIIWPAYVQAKLTRPYRPQDNLLWRMCGHQFQAYWHRVG